MSSNFEHIFDVSIQMHVQKGLWPNPTFIRFRDIGVPCHYMNTNRASAHNHPKYAMTSKIILCDSHPQVFGFV